VECHFPKIGCNEFSFPKKGDVSLIYTFFFLQISEWVVRSWQWHTLKIENVLCKRGGSKGHTKRKGKKIKYKMKKKQKKLADKQS
jgi:hypothetical protein